ncbi:MAG: hypothetical protein FJX76_11820 [Armatimonadetes bacterium]|nr:hypothetical protein [Armatimonadota bacterium]
MSLRPADLGGVMQQTGNVERMASVATQQEAQQQAQVAQSQVQGTQYAEGSTIHADSEGGNGGGYAPGRRRRAADEEGNPEEERKQGRPRQRRSSRVDFRA